MQRMENAMRTARTGDTATRIAQRFAPQADAAAPEAEKPIFNATAAQIAGLEKMLAFVCEQLEKAERDRDAWRDQAQKLARPKRFSWWR
jgi:hypothetical protein